MKLRELFSIVQEELKTIDANIQDIRLEQAEFKEKENLWEVVVSYLVENKNKIDKSFGTNLSLGMLPPVLPFERIYKLVKIDDDKNIKGLYIFKKS